jgi:hypothetical protein
LRAFDDDGGVIGGHTEKEGRIYLNSQSWAILAGIAPPDRARTSMEAVEELMDTPVGIPLLAPPYTKIQQRIGLLSRYAPGHHHNGSSWHHAVTWAMLAECRIEAERQLPGSDSPTRTTHFTGLVRLMPDGLPDPSFVTAPGLRMLLVTGAATLLLVNVVGAAALGALRAAADSWSVERRARLLPLQRN